MPIASEKNTMDDLPREEMLGVVDRVVEEILAKAAIEAPPVDAIEIAQKHLGLQVLLDKGQKQRGRAQRAGGRQQIYLRPEPTEERHQWTVAHEIGEHLKKVLLEKLGIDPEATRPMMGESLANLFACHLLVPALWFKDDVRRLEFDLARLKERYRTSSHEVLAMRFLDLSDPSIVTIVDNDRISRRKSNAWRTKKELVPAELRCQKYVHAHSKPHIVRAEGWTVHGWPVHRIEWKREILRSVVDMD